MTLQRAVLELDADVDDDGDTETGVFEMAGDLEIEEGLVVDFLLGAEISTINAITQSSLDTFGDWFDTASNRPTRRAPFYLDMGGGRHTQSINFLGWDGATRTYEDSNGNTQVEELQWGDPNEPKGSQANATGQGPMAQMHVLKEFLRQGSFDSRGENARLRYGEYSDGTYSDDGKDGLFDNHLHVVINRVQLVRSSDEPIAYSGSINFTETEDYKDVVDALSRVSW